MDKQNWQLDDPIDAVIFDCDGTLSCIEGIDYLAEQNGVGKEVKALTEQAMGVTGITFDLYQQRIELVRPNRHQLVKLGEQYFKQRAKDCQEVVQAFLQSNKKVYVISAGLNPSVKIMAELLGIHEQHVFAVDVHFDADGNYRDFDHDAPTAHNQGKRKLINEIMTQHKRILFVGDGMNDIEASDIVTRFVGYGGVHYRENLIPKCEFYIKTPSLTPLLPLGLNESEIKNLPENLNRLVQTGESNLQVGSVAYNQVA